MATGLQMQSTLLKNGTLEVSLAQLDTPELAAHEVLVRVEASPINPSDLLFLYGLWLLLEALAIIMVLY